MLLLIQIISTLGRINDSLEIIVMVIMRRYVKVIWKTQMANNNNKEYISEFHIEGAGAESFPPPSPIWEVNIVQ